VSLGGRAWFYTTALLAFAACGGNAAPTGPSPDPTAGTVSGMVNGTNWNSLSNAHWIGKPAAGSPPVIIFLFEAPVKCSEIVALGWDKTPTAAKQILEMALMDQAPRTYQIMTDAFAAYLLADYNPDAFSGTITISTVKPSTNIVGSFDLNFLPDSLAGSFDAKYCANGVEP
jgi:hypothetical protein